MNLIRLKVDDIYNLGKYTEIFIVVIPIVCILIGLFGCGIIEAVTSCIEIKPENFICFSIGILIFLEIVWLCILKVEYSNLFTHTQIKNLCNHYTICYDHHQAYCEDNNRKEIIGRKLNYAKFIAEKTANDNNYLPLILSVGSLCVSFLGKTGGENAPVLLAIFLLLLVFCVSDQKRLYAIEDAVKEYAFKEAMKEA